MSDDTSEKSVVESSENVESDNGNEKSSVTDSSSAEKGTDSHPSLDPANLHYEGDVCIYTDPATKYQYEWSNEKHEWVAKTSLIMSTTAQAPDIHANSDKGSKDDEEEFDEDDVKPKEKVINTLDMSKGTYGFENGVHTYSDPSDGAVYFWDDEKKAWFPKVDDDFLAHYQMSYGFVDNTSTSEVPKTEVKSEAGKIKGDKTETELAAEGEAAKRKAPQEPTWFQLDDENNTKVYVSNLPCDITENEFVDLMQKCGLVMKDLDTNKMKVKLYTDSETGFLKGDALCTYIKKESVELALKVLDGSDVRGKKISVERAKFTMKGEAYDPSLKPKKRRRKDKEKLKKMQEKLFDWRPEKLRGERAKHEQIVIIKNLFDPKMFDENPPLILEYKEDLREEGGKCGAVKKVVIFDRHPEGVAQINFKEAEAADACIELINGRWFGQRKISAEHWDGKTKYRVEESEKEKTERLQKWNRFLESADAGEKTEGSAEKSTSGQDDTSTKTPDVESDSNTRSSAGSGDETEEEEEEGGEKEKEKGDDKDKVEEKRKQEANDES